MVAINKWVDEMKLNPSKTNRLSIKRNSRTPRNMSFEN